jgi:hypothetical protein
MQLPEYAQHFLGGFGRTAGGMFGAYGNFMGGYQNYVNSPNAQQQSALFNFFGGVGAGARGVGRGLFGWMGEATWPARIGGGLAAGVPLLAGAAAFSGIANLTRGRYGRAALQLAAGAALVGGLYAGSRYLGGMPINAAAAQNQTGNPWAGFAW